MTRLPVVAVPDARRVRFVNPAVVPEMVTAPLAADISDANAISLGCDRAAVAPVVAAVDEPVDFWVLSSGPDRSVAVAYRMLTIAAVIAAAHVVVTTVPDGTALPV